jgi:Suppressor of fused protein (SUFU)
VSADAPHTLRLMEEYSEGGSRVYRHTDAREGEPIVPGAHRSYEAITAHVEEHVGPIAGVFHEHLSEHVHLDVLMVEGTDERPVHTLVTCGMSAKPMAAPDGGRYAELVICLPREWPLDQESWQDERHYWPVRLLKDLARLPHAYDTFLDTGHTIPNGDPPEPYAPGTKLCCALIAPPLSTPDAFDELETAHGRVRFHGVTTMHREEMQLKLDKGVEALVEPFARDTVGELVVPDRPSAVPRKKRFGLF